MGTAIAITDLVLNTWTQGATTLGTLTTMSSTAEIAHYGGSYRWLLAISNATSTISITATIVKGDNPPSLLAGKGAAATQTIAVLGTYYLSLEGGVYTHDDGVVRITFAGSTDAGAVRIQAIRLPRGA